MADRGAASKSKAYAISQKKIITGVIPIGESSNKADWFKIKIGRNKKLYVDIDSKCSGKIRFQLYGPAQKTDAQSQLSPTVKEPTTLAMREQESQSD